MKHLLNMLVVVLLLGAGCTASTANQPEPGTGQAGAGPKEEPATMLALDERLAAYMAERETCVEQRLKEWVGTEREGENYGAEYQCTIKVMAPKYYKDDPEGMTELCVRLYQVSAYTKEGGILGGLTPEELEKEHALGVRTGVTLDENGKMQYDEATAKGWRQTCKNLIEFNLE